ncbi:MAG: 4-alpha-glucanotransferase [Acidobacteriota bacterium]
MSNPGSRRAGLLIPLFACASAESWGIGDIGDLPTIARWLAEAGQRVLQLLPLNEMAPGQQSPYSAISAMAIDPIYISLSMVPEFVALGGEETLNDEDRVLLAQVRRAPRVDYANVRALKQRACRIAFERFYATEWRNDTTRARAFRLFLSEQAWWIEDYAIFRAVHVREGERPWTEWPEALQRREPTAIDHARRELSGEVLFHQYLQWLAGVQWQQARSTLHGVQLFGDLPFMVDTDSADVWARQDQFRLDLSLGAPPDAFSATGQDWGMPVYRWNVIALQDFRWLHERARRSADLFNGYRIDHLVGFYRTYGRPRDGADAFFSPATQREQEALGERVLGLFRAAGAEIIAEDLGTVPDFVRGSLARQGIPGFRVLRWERYWHAEGQPFRDPADYPAVSVAASGTHDTEPMVTWWEAASDDERRKLNAVPTVQRISGGSGILNATSAEVRDVLLETLFASKSDLLLLPVQDVFGWPDRINEPATVTDGNWTFRLPWPIDRLHNVPEARERQATLRQWATRHDRV